MSVTLTIGMETRDASQWTDPEINQRLSRHREDGDNPCVKVRISTPTVELTLVTRTCGGLGGGGRLTPEQEELRDLWVRSHMFDDHFTGGNLIAFLHQIRRLAA